MLYANKQWGEQLTAVEKAFGSIPDDFELVHEWVLQSYRMRHGIRSWIKEFPGTLKTYIKARGQRLPNPLQLARCLLG